MWADVWETSDMDGWIVTRIEVTRQRVAHAFFSLRLFELSQRHFLVDMHLLWLGRPRKERAR